MTVYFGRLNTFSLRTVYLFNDSFTGLRGNYIYVGNVYVKYTVIEFKINGHFVYPVLYVKYTVG